MFSTSISNYSELQLVCLEADSFETTCLELSRRGYHPDDMLIHNFVDYRKMLTLRGRTILITKLVFAPEKITLEIRGPSLPEFRPLILQTLIEG